MFPPLDSLTPLDYSRVPQSGEEIRSAIVDAFKWLFGRFRRKPAPTPSAVDSRGLLDIPQPIGPSYLPTLDDLESLYESRYEKFTRELLAGLLDGMDGYRGVVEGFPGTDARLAVEFFFPHGEIFVLFMPNAPGKRLVRVRCTLNAKPYDDAEEYGTGLYLKTVCEVLRRLEDHFFSQPLVS